MRTFKISPWYDDDGKLEFYQLLIIDGDIVLTVNLPVGARLDITGFQYKITIQED